MRRHGSSLKEALTREKNLLIPCTGNLKIDGTGNQITEMIIKETRTHLLDPFTFHWKKSGFLPWSWKLIRIEHSKLEVPSGYVPGKSFNSLRC